MRLFICRSILLSIISSLLAIGCSVPKPTPTPEPKRETTVTPKPKRETTVTPKPKRERASTPSPIKVSPPRKDKSIIMLESSISKPTDQIHIFDLTVTDINGNPLQSVEFQADVELLGSIENENLINSKEINYETDYSGFVHFEITHPITQTQSGYSTYTLVNFLAFKDGYIDISGSFNLEHNDQTLSNEYQKEKYLSKSITMLKIEDFVDNAFGLLSEEANISYNNIENCIETFVLFPSTYGQLKTGSVTLVKNSNKLFLEFGFINLVDDDWLLETFKSIGRRMGSSLFKSEITSIRLRIDQDITYSASIENVGKYLDREYSDSEFLSKINRG